ncbi:hypothetical protein LBMAG56_20740 [Verrucomicrobiota bacterium]|nr:hypothetical protein LBMAG56_20740 [Verrucomicrobiota bacterium]
MNETLEARLIRVESHLAHLEKLCDDLNRIVAEQDKQLTRLQFQQRTTTELLANQELERIHADHSKPPHYS